MQLGRGASGVCFKVISRENADIVRCVKKMEKAEMKGLPV